MEHEDGEVCRDWKEFASIINTTATTDMELDAYIITSISYDTRISARGPSSQEANIESVNKRITYIVLLFFNEVIAKEEVRNTYRPSRRDVHNTHCRLTC